jgi:hypothetical protein
MDPVTIATVAAVATAAGTAVTAYGSSQSMKSQAEADQRRAAIEGQWAERRALEERSAAQRGAGEETRKAKLAQSRLTALAGASGGGSSDPTIMDLWGDIEKEGEYNARQVTAAGEQKATGMEYQADLDMWSADANARIKRAGANTTLIGGLLSSAGQLSGGMSARYGGARNGGSGGYGRYG